jgi:hypothetical protein
MSQQVPDIGGILKNAALDPNKMLGEVLDRSERWNTGQKVAAAVVSFGGAGLLLGIGSPRIIIAAILALVGISFLTVRRRSLEVESVVIRSSDGKKRIVLAATPDGGVLGLYDDAGMVRAHLHTASGGPALGLRDQNGKLRTSIGDGLIGLLDESEKPRLTAAAPGGAITAPVIGLAAAQTEAEINLMVTEANTPMVKLQDSHGTHMLTPSASAMESSHGGTAASMSIGNAAHVDCSAGGANVQLLADDEKGASQLLTTQETTAVWGIHDHDASVTVLRDSEPVASWRTSDCKGDDERSAAT